MQIFNLSPTRPMNCIVVCSVWQMKIDAYKFSLPYLISNILPNIHLTMTSLPSKKRLLLRLFPDSCTLSMSLASCNDDVSNIGSSLVTDESNIVVDSTFLPLPANR